MNYKNIIQLLKEFDYDRNSKDSLIDFLSIMLHYLDEIPTPLLTPENCDIEEIPQFKGTLEELDNLTLGDK